MRTEEKQFQQPAISVIVPIYNTIDYLEECLNSLVLQTLQNIEFILIDDGSTDGSGIVCDNYAQKDSRFRIIHKQNEGLASARNEGVRVARADYIMFVDSDDWVSPVFCEEPLNIAKNNNADLVVFQFDRCEKGKVKNRKPFPNEGIIPKEDILTVLWPNTTVTVWNKLFKRELFNEIEFPDGHLCEDLAVTYRLVYAANKIYVSNSCIYHHRINRPGSISFSDSIEFKKDRILYDLTRLAQLKQWGYVSEIDLKAKSIVYLFIMGDQGELSSNCIAEIRKGTLKQFLMESILWKYKMLFLIYFSSPSLFHLIAMVTGKRINTCTVREMMADYHVD